LFLHGIELPGGGVASIDIQIILRGQDQFLAGSYLIGIGDAVGRGDGWPKENGLL